MNTNIKPKKITNIAYTCFILFGAILTIIRWISEFHPDLVVINADVNSHISNFACSLVFYLGVGYSWILQKNSMKKILILGVAVIGANIVCETVMGCMNTTDIIDAVYGIVATVIGFCFLFVASKYGLETTKDKEEIR